MNNSVIDYEAIVKSLNKKYKDIIIRNPLQVNSVIPTGSLELDMAIGVGGYPSSRIVEIFGAESSGKSTLCLHAIIAAQKLGIGCVYVDVEHTYDSQYAKSLGVDNLDILIAQPDTAEVALELIEDCVHIPDIGLVILDSLAALVPHRESIGEGEVGDSHVGLVPRIMSQFTRRIVPALAKSNSVIIITNQVRDRLGITWGGTGVNPPGGHAIKHTASVRIQLSRIQIHKESDGEITGTRVKAEVKKNKVAPPFGTAEFDIMIGRGIDFVQELVIMAIKNGTIVKNGAWYKFDDITVQGMDKAKEVIIKNPDYIDKILYTNTILRRDVYKSLLTNV